MATDFGFHPIIDPLTQEFYIVSYNTEDAPRIKDVVMKLHTSGMPVWYDYGLEYGEKWQAQIAEYISRTKALIMFITIDIFKKHDPYILKEYSLAKFFGKPVIPVIIDNIYPASVPTTHVTTWLEICALHGIECKGVIDVDRIVNEIFTATHFTPTSAGQAQFSGSQSPSQQTAPSKGVARSVAVGDRIKYGRYPQSSNLAEPIEWQIISLDNNRALVVSSHVLDARPFHTAHTEITWDQCYLHRWLNTEFLNQAFSVEEQTRIVPVNVFSPGNPSLGIQGGSPVVDKLFCLSLEEVNQFLTTSKSRISFPTSHAIGKGAEKSEFNRYGCSWWLRSPGFCAQNAALVLPDGEIRTQGNSVSNETIGVRPAFLIRL